MESVDEKIQDHTDLLELCGQAKGELILIDPFSIAAAVPQGDGSTKVKVSHTEGYHVFVKETPEEIQSKRRALLKARHG